jgi:hypothetical protein
VKKMRQNENLESGSDSIKTGRLKPCFLQIVPELM